MLVLLTQRIRDKDGKVRLAAWKLLKQQRKDICLSYYLELISQVEETELVDIFIQGLADTHTDIKQMTEDIRKC